MALVSFLFLRTHAGLVTSIHYDTLHYHLTCLISQLCSGYVHLIWADYYSWPIMNCRVIHETR